MSEVEDVELGSAVSHPGVLDVKNCDPAEYQRTPAAFHGPVPGTVGGCTTEHPPAAVGTSAGLAVRA